MLREDPLSLLRYELNVSPSQKLQVHQGDLTQEDCDAIVNAANSRLAHGGGVAGAIVRRGGFSIQVESDRWVKQHGQVPTGHVAVTGAGTLACKWIIHAVGPVWNGGGSHEDELLGQAITNSLLKAEELNLRCIAFPAISSGIFGFPKERCAGIMVSRALEFYRGHPQSPLQEIRFTNIDEPTAIIFENALKAMKNKNK
jgi:O-acetyl-ADP-ribose deacetylase (regulator of RNase III)